MKISSRILIPAFITVPALQAMARPLPVSLDPPTLGATGAAVGSFSALLPGQQNQGRHSARQRPASQQRCQANTATARQLQLQQRHTRERRRALLRSAAAGCAAIRTPASYATTGMAATAASQLNMQGTYALRRRVWALLSAASQVMAILPQCMVLPHPAPTTRHPVTACHPHLTAEPTYHPAATTRRLMALQVSSSSMRVGLLGRPRYS